MRPNLGAKLAHEMFGPGPNASVVRVSNDAAGWGLNVVVELETGHTLRYAHMSTVYVLQGQSIGTGKVIGRVGMTGLATGPHVHWELRNPSDSIMNPQSCVLWEPDELEACRRRADPRVHGRMRILRAELNRSELGI